MPALRIWLRHISTLVRQKRCEYDDEKRLVEIWQVSSYIQYHEVTCLFEVKGGSKQVRTRGHASVADIYSYLL